MNTKQRIKELKEDFGEEIAFHYERGVKEGKKELKKELRKLLK